MRVSEQTKKENRNRVLEMATELFRQKGFEDTTTRDIAQQAGVAAGTLFNYFPSKESMAMSLVTEAMKNGHQDYLSRCTGEESLVEELFIFNTSALRRLRPMHSFIGPVLERSLSPFPRKIICPEGETARINHLAAVQDIISRHGFTSAPDYVAMTMYWSLYLGILAHWSHDTSPNQNDTLALIDYSLRLFVTMISGIPGADAGEDYVR